MLTWTERPLFRYLPPDDAPPPPRDPRHAYVAQAPDGALLEAFVFGTALVPPLALELRRHGAPAIEPPADEAHPAFHDPAFPTLEELQDAANNLLPPGTMLSVLMLAMDPGGAPPAGRYRSVTAVQFANARAPRGVLA